MTTGIGQIWVRPVSHLGIYYSSRGVVVVKISFISLYFECFVAKDSNVSSLTICADRGEASRTYEICILFADMASIESSSPFCVCWR